jgi:quinoprotein glucose dehydrogenase
MCRPACRALIVAAAAMAAWAQTTGAKPKARGKAEYERICSACHDLGAGTANRRTRAQWAAVVEDMAAMGAGGTKAELRLVVDYLTANFGTE